MILSFITTSPSQPSQISSSNASINNSSQASTSICSQQTRHWMQLIPTQIPQQPSQNNNQTTQSNLHQQRLAATTAMQPNLMTHTLLPHTHLPAHTSHNGIWDPGATSRFRGSCTLRHLRPGISTGTLAEVLREPMQEPPLNQKQTIQSNLQQQPIPFVADRNSDSPWGDPANKKRPGMVRFY